LLFGWFGLFVRVFFVRDSSPIVDMCFDDDDDEDEDEDVYMLCVLFFVRFWRLKSLSSVCVSEERKRVPFLIFLSVV
jgi:hypothetical protein